MHLLFVCRLVILADETYHGCVISERDIILALHYYTVVIQQSEQQRTEHTAL